ncbi:MAG: Lrp/AsnC family leucine-responsive transcriptional regulator [Sphingobacteriales bacterium]|jgi:Lrp/AsnC family leucine-responsive transcriptional regulator
MDKLDRIDIRILDLLQNDARLTNKQIAEELGMSTTPVFERIKKLEKKGVIQKYVALVDRRKVGKNLLAYGSVRLKEHTQTSISTFVAQVKDFPEVIECMHTTGMGDYLLKIVVDDMDAYHRFVMDKLSAITVISHVETSFVLDEVIKTTAFPLLTEKNEQE